MNYTKGVTYFKGRCRHCAYLFEDKEKEWACDNGENPIMKCKDIVFCDAVEKESVK